MLLEAKGELLGKHLVATDGRIGSVRDVYFDDQRWVVRYLEVDAGTGVPGRKVLISPASIRRDGTGDKDIAVTLTCEQVRNSPGPDEHRPVSRQFEEAHANYYGYPFYWDGPYLWGSSQHPITGEPSVTTPPQGVTPRERTQDLKEAEEQARESHLRSSDEVIGYRVVATDGPIGHVEDFVVDDTNWAIDRMIVDTRNWLPGKHVLVPVDAVDKVDWLTREMRLKVTRDEVEDAPRA